MRNPALQTLILRAILCAIASLFLGGVFSSAHASMARTSTDQAANILNALRANKTKFMAQAAPTADNAALIISIYDRLIFALSSRYQKGDIHSFMSDYCIFLAEVEFRDNRPLVEFYVHLSDVIKNSREERENLGVVIENYIHAAPVEEPLTAARFILNNSYTNGSTGTRANGVGREDLGSKEQNLIVEKVSDFEFSGELEAWFSNNDQAEEKPSEEKLVVEPIQPEPNAETPIAPESKDSQTSEPSSQQTQPLESSTIPIDSHGQLDKPASNTETPQPPAEHSQTTTASTSEPKPETTETK